MTIFTTELPAERKTKKKKLQRKKKNRRENQARHSQDLRDEIFNLLCQEFPSALSISRYVVEEKRNNRYGWKWDGFFFGTRCVRKSNLDYIY